MTTTWTADWVSPPGDTLLEVLDERGLTQTELAERLGVSLKHVNRIVHGAAAISPAVAVDLETVLGVSAGFWLAREAKYRADIVRAERAERADAWWGWAKEFPLAELRKRGLLPAGLRGSANVEPLLRFLGVARPEHWAPPPVAFRRGRTTSPEALATWLREGDLRAAEVVTEPFDAAGFRSVLDSARGWTRLEPNEAWSNLERACRSVGVVVVLVDNYPGAAVNGASRWLAPNRALIQLSLRYRWEDILWFTFFHEAAHLLLHGKRTDFVDVAGAPVDAERQRLEDEANQFAADLLIDPQAARRLGSLAVAEIATFADKLGVSPAVVVGRMQHDQLLGRDQGNHLRRRLESSPERVAPPSGAAGLLDDLRTAGGGAVDPFAAQPRERP